MWTVGRDLRLFPQCREAACIAAYCTQVVRQLAGPLDAAASVVALDTYGWDVDIPRMYCLPPLWCLYRSLEDYYDHVMDRVSVAQRSVGLHTRRQLQDALNDMPFAAHFLANALEEALAETGCEILVMRYGMKLPAEDVFPLLLQCRDLMALEHGELFARKCWKNKVVDFGTQNVLFMQPTLVFRKNNLHEVSWVINKTVQSYSSFGKLGDGYGGVQFQGTADGPCQKVSKLCW